MTVLKSDFEYTKLYSTKDTPESYSLNNSLGFDTFCEKPPFIPELESDLDRNCSMFYPFGDKLDGYNLYDVFHKNFLPAKGTAQAGITYYEIKSKRYEIKDVQVGDSVQGLYIKSESIPLMKNSEASRRVYSNSFYSESFKYGEKINFTYDGVMPGSNKSSDNLLIDSSSFDTFSTDTNTIFNTPPKIITKSAGSFSEFTIESNQFSQKSGYFTLSLFSRIITDSELKGVFLVEIYTDNDSNGKKYPVFNLSSDWTNNIFTFKFDNPITKFFLKFRDISVTSSVNGDKIEFCGLMLNEGQYAINFDRKYHFKSSNILYNKMFPILINFLRPSSEDYLIPKNNSWTITYQRFLNIQNIEKVLGEDVVTFNVNEDKIDTIGNNYVNIGYKNNKPVVTVNGQVYESSINSAYKRGFEKIFIIYNASNSTLTCKIYRNFELIYEKTISSIDSSRFSVSETVNDKVVNYDLILGGFVNNGVQVNKFTKYSDLIIIPRVLNDEEIYRMTNSMMSVDFNCMAYNDKTTYTGSQGTPETTVSLDTNMTSLRGSKFFWTRNI